MSSNLRLAAIVLAAITFAVVGYVFALHHEAFAGVELRTLSVLVLVVCWAFIIFAVLRKRSNGSV